MAGNLFIFGFKKLPKAFIVFLSLLILTEAISGIIIKKLPSRHCLQRIISMVSKGDMYSDILIIGDSFALTAFYSKDKVFSSSDKLMSGTVSLATNAEVTMAGQYFVLKRYLEKNNPPQKVILISTPFLWDSSPGKFSDNYFFSCFNNTQEIKDILLFSRNANFLVRMLYYKFLPSAQCSLYLAEFQGKSQDTRRKMLAYLKNVISMKLGLKPQGSLDEELSEINKPQPLVAKAPTTEVIPPLPGERIPSVTQKETKVLPEEIIKIPEIRLLSEEELRGQGRNFSIHYFNKICAMLKQKGVQLYYVDAATTYTLFKQQGGYFISCRDFIKTLEKKENNFIYLDGLTPLYFADEYFFDKNHLNSLGARYYLHIFNESLKKLAIDS